MAYIPAHSHPWRPAPGQKGKSGTDRAERRLAELVSQHGYVLLYDGECVFCNRLVQFILKHDKSGAMRFAALQGELGKAAVRVLPSVANVDSVVLMHREGAWVRSTAALEAARYVGGVWSLALAGYIVPRFIRDWLYDWFARRRYAWFGKYDSCPVPSAETRSRIVDL